MRLLGKSRLYIVAEAMESHGRKKVTWRCEFLELHVQKRKAESRSNQGMDRTRRMRIGRNPKEMRGN